MVVSDPSQLGLSLCEPFEIPYMRLICLCEKRHEIAEALIGEAMIAAD
jgi:hypothetical protein